MLSSLTPESPQVNTTKPSLSYSRDKVESLLFQKIYVKGYKDNIDMSDVGQF